MRRRSTSVSDVLGGARPKHQRPRGFITDWNPRSKKRELLAQVQAVIEEYRDYHPLTIRQIFYRLVANYDFPKTTQAYKGRLCELMTEARRARVIPMEVIRDDTVTTLDNSGFASKLDFLEMVRDQAARVTLDRSACQQTRLVVFCEAAGMAPQLARVASEYGVAVTASGGFDSLTSKYDLARSFADEERDIEVLHIGDHDPSGGHMFVTWRTLASSSPI
jgi:hypothetical protein